MKKWLVSKEKTFWSKFRNQGKRGLTKKLWYLLFCNFRPLLQKCYFWKRLWTLSYISTKFWDFPDISVFILCQENVNKSKNFGMQEFLILYKNSKSAKGDKKVGVFLPSFFKQNGEQIINIFASYCAYQFCIARHDNCQIISLFPPGI